MGSGMEKRQITRQELVAAALKLGACRGPLRRFGQQPEAVVARLNERDQI